GNQDQVIWRRPGLHYLPERQDKMKRAGPERAGSFAFSLEMGGRPGLRGISEEATPKPRPRPAVPRGLRRCGEPEQIPRGHISPPVTAPASPPSKRRCRCRQRNEIAP